MIPREIVSGDDVYFEASYDSVDYENSTAEFLVSNVDSAFSIQSSAYTAGDIAFKFSASSAETSTWLPGDYRFQVKITDGSGLISTIDTGSIEIAPDYSNPVDDRSHVKKVLDALEATLENKATSDQLAYSIAGRSISRMSPSELLDWYDRYKRMYDQEQKEEELDEGGKSGSGKIKAVFAE